MKKVFAIILAVCALGVVISGCGNKEADADKAATDTPKDAGK